MNEEAVAWEKGGKKETWKAMKELLQDLEDNLRVMQFGRWWEKVQSKEEQRRIMREASGCNDEEEEYHKGNLQCSLHKQSAFLHSKKKKKLHRLP
jgi:hypothetical protein